MVLVLVVNPQLRHSHVLTEIGAAGNAVLVYTHTDVDTTGD